MRLLFSLVWFFTAAIQAAEPTAPLAVRRADPAMEAVPGPNFTCLPSYEQLSGRRAQALETERDQRKYVDTIIAQQHRDSDFLAGEIERANANGLPFVVDVAGVGGGPHNAIGFASLRSEMPDGVFLIFESEDRFGTFDKMRSFDVNTKEMSLESGNTFPGIPVQPRDLNPHGVKYVPSTNFGDVTALGHHYSRTRVVFGHKQLGVEVEPSPGAWPAPYKFKLQRTDKYGNTKTLYVYARAQLAAPGFGEPEARVSDPASQELIAREQAVTQKAMAIPETARTHAPGIQTVDSMLRIAGDDARDGRSPMDRYGDGDFVVVGPRDGGAIGVEAITGLNATLNPSGLPTQNKVTWLGQKAKSGAEYRDAIPNQARIDRYIRIGGKIDSGQISSHGGYLQKVEEFLDNGHKRYKLFVSERVDGSGAQSTVETSHVVLATGYSNGVMKLFEGLGTAEAPPKLQPLVQNPQHYTSNPSLQADTTIASQVVTQNPDGSTRAHPIFVVGNAILNTAGGGAISKKESGGAVGGFIDILGPRSAAAGRRLGLDLNSGKSPVQLQRLELAPTVHPNNYFDREYLVSSKPDHPRPLIFQNRPATELDTKIHLARLLSQFRLPAGPDPVDFEITRDDGRIHLRVYGLSSMSSQEVATAIEQNGRVIQLLDNLFDLGGRSVHITTPVRATGTIESENIVFRVD